MQQDAVDCATQALEKFNIEKDIAAYIKKGICSLLYTTTSPILQSHITPRIFQPPTIQLTILMQIQNVTSYAPKI
jgi:hypothetical protein